MIPGVLIVRIHGAPYLRIGAGRRACVCIAPLNMANAVHGGPDGGSTDINCYSRFCTGALKSVKNLPDRSKPYKSISSQHNPDFFPLPPSLIYLLLLSAHSALLTLAFLLFLEHAKLNLTRVFVLAGKLFKQVTPSFHLGFCSLSLPLSSLPYLSFPLPPQAFTMFYFSIWHFVYCISTPL